MLFSKSRNGEETWLGEDTMPLGVHWDSWLVQQRHGEVRGAPENYDSDLKV